MDQPGNDKLVHIVADRVTDRLDSNHTITDSDHTITDNVTDQLDNRQYITDQLDSDHITDNVTNSAHIMTDNVTDQLDSDHITDNVTNRDHIRPDNYQPANDQLDCKVFCNSGNHLGYQTFSWNKEMDFLEIGYQEAYGFLPPRKPYYCSVGQSQIANDQLAG